MEGATGYCCLFASVSEFVTPYIRQTYPSKCMDVPTLLSVRIPLKIFKSLTINCKGCNDRAHIIKGVVHASYCASDERRRNLNQE